MKKELILKALSEYNIRYCSNLTAVEAKTLLRNYIRNNLEHEIIKLAESEGHQVIFTPPHYSELQPIEPSWAKIKKSIARKYTRGFIFQNMRDKLDDKFKIYRLLVVVVVFLEFYRMWIRLLKFMTEIRATEELDATDSGSDYCSNSSNTSLSTIDLVN